MRESVRLSFTVSIDEALARDRVRSQALVAGDQSRALRHVFFAERAAAKLPEFAGRCRTARCAERGYCRRGHHGRRHCDVLYGGRYPG
ncbi:MAG: hypothetical protein WDN04_03110 [Rhodospirillales bacterium]